MTNEELQQIKDIVKEEITSHLHGVNAARIPWNGVKVSPEAAITAANGTAFSTAGATKLDSDNITILNNMRDRIGEIEEALQDLKLLE